MEVTAIPVRTLLQLRLQVGLDEKGNPKFSNRSFANIKPAADNEDLYQLGQILVELQEHELEAFRRVDEVELEIIEP